MSGIGGGRIIDIAKAAGDMADASIFTIPTSAATCAAYAVLYVVYGEDGNVDHSGFLNHEISGVIVDMDLVVQGAILCRASWMPWQKNRNSALPWPI